MRAAEIAAALCAVRAENLAALHRRSQVEAVHRLGPRVLAELLDELRRHHPGATADIDRGIAKYAGTDPALLLAAGADVMARPPIWGVGQ